MRLTLLLMASLFSFLLGGCLSSSSDKVLFEGTYQGAPYTVKSHDTSNFNGTRTDWRLQLDDLPELPVNITRLRGTPVAVDGVVTTDWGPPYSDDLFDGHERVYLSGAPAYNSVGNDYKTLPQAQHDQTMLYVSEKLSAQQFRRYAACMKAEWPRIDKALAFDPATNFPHIIGLVHGSKQRFVRNFEGLCNGVPHVLRVDPDGFVNLDPSDVANVNHMRHCKVQMPGKVIALHQIYGWQDYKTSKAEVSKFVDSNGKTPGDYFELKD